MASRSSVVHSLPPVRQPKVPAVGEEEKGKKKTHKTRKGKSKLPSKLPSARNARKGGACEK